MRRDAFFQYTRANGEVIEGLEDMCLEFSGLKRLARLVVTELYTECCNLTP